MSSKPALEVVHPAKFEPDPRVIEDLEELLERARNGEIRALGTITECLDDDGGRAVDWHLTGSVRWAAALYGAAMMLADEAKEVVKRKLAIDAGP